ncbi:MAG TPA: hypothetical protein VNH40_05755 [Gaiellaceae bacterium]|nr:hypothetical protein [Gaiellaceae bacterium]
MRATTAAVAIALALSLGVAGAAAHGGASRTCPKAWAAGWVKLADRVGVPVYCPTWMPNPIDARIGGQYQDIYSIGKDRSYLVSFLYHGEPPSGDVHVNFRGYPGRTTIPRCKTIILAGKNKTLRGTTPCFADARGTEKANGITARLYTVNQDADQWHLLLAWRYSGSLYTVSEHVIKPYTQRQVMKNLRRLLRSLVLVRPTSG